MNKNYDRSDILQAVEQKRDLLKSAEVIINMTLDFSSAFQDIELSTWM